MLHHHVLEAPLVPSPYLLRLVHEIDNKMKCIDLLFILSFHRHRDHIHTLRKPLEPSPRGFPHFKEMKLYSSGAFLLYQGAFLILRK